MEKKTITIVIDENTKNPELAATSELMVSSDYKDRFMAEYIQLRNRIQSLDIMLRKWDNNELNFKPTCPRCTYRLQMKAMCDYAAILAMRAKMEGIELPEEDKL